MKEKQTTIPIDWGYVAEQSKARCSVPTIARALGVSKTTLYNKCIEDNGITLAEFREEHKITGEDLLKKKMFDIAMNGNVNMLIWLSKNWLKYSDKPEDKEEKQEITVNFNLKQ